MACPCAREGGAAGGLQTATYAYICWVMANATYRAPVLLRSSSRGPWICTDTYISDYKVTPCMEFFLRLKECVEVRDRESERTFVILSIDTRPTVKGLL